MLKMVCCLVLVGVAAAAPQDHSIQKRQTTVTFTSKYEDIREVFVNVVVAFAFASVAVLVVLPLLGYKIDIVVAAAEDLLGANAAATTGEAATGYLPADYSAPEGGYAAPEGGYAAPDGYANEGYARSLQTSLLNLSSRVYNSIDVVEAAMTYSAIEEEACRFKAVCRAEYAAAKNPIARLAINTINSNLNGLSKYGAAVAAGLNGEDCDLLYSACPEAVGFF